MSRKSKCNITMGNINSSRKLNKRILKEKTEAKRFRIIVIISLLILTSPLWFYRGIMYEILLPIYGKTTKAVLVGTIGPTSWSKYRYKTRDYFYSFSKNGKIYEHNANIKVNDSLFHIGDTVDILYLEALPFISSRIRNDAN